MSRSAPIPWWALTSYAGVIYTAMYWHFLDAVWLVLFATLLICGR